jgi:serine/threonine protein kinase
MISSQAQLPRLMRQRSRTIQVANLPNETALHNRMANVRLLQEAMGDEVLRRTRYSAKSMGDGVTIVKGYSTLSQLATCDDEELFLDDLEVIQPLGHGAFSTVELVRVPSDHALAKEHPQSLFAVKRINVSGNTPYGFRGHAPPLPACEVSAFDSISMMAEGALMKNLNHPNVLKCYGAIGRRAAAKLDGDGASVRRSALILDYAPGGSLRDRMDQQDYTPQQGIDWLLGIARGMCYLHELDGLSVAHRDLKPSNILIGADGEAKIADLGLFRLMQGTSKSTPNEGVASGLLGSRRASTDSHDGSSIRHGFGFFSPRVSDATLAPQPSGTPTWGAKKKAANLSMTGRTGTFAYMAPENWRAKAAYTQKVDIYSFAIITWEILTQIPAYIDMRVEPQTLGEWTAERGMRPLIPPPWPAEIAALVVDCWGSRPEKRPTARAVLDRLERFKALADIDKGLYAKLSAEHQGDDSATLTVFNAADKDESWIKSLGLHLPTKVFHRTRSLSSPAVHL